MTLLGYVVSGWCIPRAIINALEEEAMQERRPMQPPNLTPDEIRTVLEGAQGDLFNPHRPTHPRNPHVNPGPKVRRNDPCPCGSGKKFKKCCNT